MSHRLGVIGVPTSAAAFAPGQENGPRALRDAGLIRGLIVGALRPEVNALATGNTEYP